MSSDDNGQDLTNYNFATDGFRTANAASNDVYLATGGNETCIDRIKKKYFFFDIFYNVCFNPIQSNLWFLGIKI